MLVMMFESLTPISCGVLQPLSMALVSQSGGVSMGEVVARLTVALLSILVLLVFLIRSQRKTAAIAQRAEALTAALREAEKLLESRSDPANDQRNALMFAQHTRINELTIAKLDAEVQLLQSQLSSRDVNDDRLEAGKEYHELMVEKTRLEMDSLRLHIAELRKRAEDWGTDE
jgi:Tfp pilus assembly protein PilV